VRGGFSSIAASTFFCAGRKEGKAAHASRTAANNTLVENFINLWPFNGVIKGFTDCGANQHFHTVDDSIESAAGAQQADGNQHAHDIGNDAYCRFKPALGAFYKSVEHIDLFIQTTQYNKKEQERLRKLYRFIDENYQRRIEIDEVANLTSMSNGGFCRYFKKITRLTFTEFLNHYRINQAKRLLLLDKNITETCYEAGFESLSYFNRTFKKITSENPLTFKKRYLLK